MTERLVRTYVTLVGVLVFLAIWLTVSTHVFPTQPASAAADPIRQRLAAEDVALQQEAAATNAVVAQRWNAYTVARRRRLHRIAQAKQRWKQQKAAAEAAAAAAAASPSYVRSYSSGGGGGSSYRSSGGGGGGGSASGGGGSSYTPAAAAPAPVTVVVSRPATTTHAS